MKIKKCIYICMIFQFSSRISLIVPMSLNYTEPHVSTSLSQGNSTWFCQTLYLDTKSIQININDQFCEADTRLMAVDFKIWNVNFETLSLAMLLSECIILSASIYGSKIWTIWYGRYSDQWYLDNRGRPFYV